MVQTLNIKQDGTFQINFGSIVLEGSTNDEYLPAQLLAKVREVESTITESGISELHVEKDTFKSFEHAVTAGKVSPFDFGTHVSEELFNGIMDTSSLFD